MSKKNNVLVNSFLYTFSSLLVKAMTFFLLPVYTKFLSPNDYGTVNLINSFIHVATFIVSFSLYNAIIRFYADYKNDKEKLKIFFGTIIIFIFFSGIVFSLLGIIFKEILLLVFKDIPFYPVVLIAILTLLFSSLHTAHQNMLQGMQQGKKLTIVNLIVFANQVCLNLVFIWFFKLEATGVLLSNLIIYIGYSFYIIIDLKKRNLITFCIDKSILKETLSYSIPLMPHNLSAQIANLTSRIFINTNYSLSMVGLYSVSTQFSVIIDIIQSSTNQAFTPWFFGIMNNGTKDNKKEIVNLSNFLLTIYSLLYMIIGLFSQDVIILMTSKDYILAWTSVPILVIAYSIKSIYYFYVNILFYYKQASRTLFLATITGSTFDIFLAYILVPLFGIYGAAISFLIAKIIIVIIVIILSKRYDDIGYRAVNMLKIIIPSLLFMGVGLYFSYTKYMSVFSITNFCYKIVLFIIYLIYLYFTNKKAIVEIINSGILKSLFDFKKLNKFERNYMND